jgi:cytochrome c
MKRSLAALLIGVFAGAQPTSAGDRATTGEAKAMAEKAAAFLVKNGRDAARAAFMAKGGEWHDRDLYVFSMDGKAVMTSHGQIDSMVGKDTIDMTDAAGKSYRRDIVAIKTADWVDYLFKRPQSDEIELKSSYCVRALPDDIVCVGAYK